MGSFYQAVIGMGKKGLIEGEMFLARSFSVAWAWGKGGTSLFFFSFFCYRVCFLTLFLYSLPSSRVCLSSYFFLFFVFATKCDKINAMRWILSG